MPRRATAQFTFVFCVAVFAMAGEHRARAQADCPQSLIIYHAGSLTAAFTPIEKLFTQQTGTCITDVAAGSLDAARRVTAGQEPADIFATADDVDIDVLLKPSWFAGYNIVFAQGGMVLAYTTSSHNAASIADAGTPLSPPNSIPSVAADWYDQLTQPGVLIGGSNPFLDPSGYRADMIFQLAAQRYAMPALYNALLEHYTISRTTDVLGANYDYTFTYEHSAAAAYRANPSTYRYAKLPDAVGLSSSDPGLHYNTASTVVPGLGLPGTAPHVRIPATRVAWGVTILRTAPHYDAAIQFLQLLFSPQGVALQSASGPAPISPPIVSAPDYDHLSDALKPLVSKQ